MCLLHTNALGKGINQQFSVEKTSPHEKAYNTNKGETESG